MLFEPGDFFSIFAFTAVLLMVPYIMIVASSFVKIAIVMMILRNALGVQQTPPNVVLYTIALALTLLIMQPIGFIAFENVSRLELDFSQASDFWRAAQSAFEPMREFLQHNARADDLEFYKEVNRQVWLRYPQHQAVESELITLIPAFLQTELTEAFEMGFLLYLPFLAIDLVVTAVLIAMGMNMVQPTIVAIPFKLLLFVSLSGWEKLTQGLLMSYIAT